MDHHAGGSAWAVAADAMACCTQAKRWRSFADGGHHVSPGIHEGARKVIRRRHGVPGLSGARAFGIRSGESETGVVIAGTALRALVELGLGGFRFVSLEERAGGYRARAALEFSKSADAIFEELEGLGELVRGDLGDPVIGEEIQVLGVAEWVREQDAQLV